MKREPGFYWVVYLDHEDGWEIARYDEDELWFLCGSVNPHGDEDFKEIDESEIIRNKPLQEIRNKKAFYIDKLEKLIDEIDGL